jgi:hypothetical protein
MASYQDMDVRLAVCEDKIDMLMKMASVTKREPSTLMPGEYVETRMSLFDLYKELKREGIRIDNPSKETVTENGDDQ